MAQLSAYSKDLYELVAALDDRGVLRPGEREAWEEGIDDADEISELRTIEEAPSTKRCLIARVSTRSSASTQQSGRRRLSNGQREYLEALQHRWFIRLM